MKNIHVNKKLITIGTFHWIVSTNISFPNFFYIITVLFILSILQIKAETRQENETSRTVKLVVSGEGVTKDEATKIALRSAIEQAFGTFVSSNTDILNDDVIKDEIVTVSSGNIQSYKELSTVDLGSTKMVNIEAVVSIGNLVSFAKSRGMSVELAGATFAMNMKLKELNKQNERKALENLYKQMAMMVDNTYLFDYKLEVGEPYQTDDRCYGVDVYVSLIPNSNMSNFWELYFNTIKSIRLTVDEANELNAARIQIYPYFSGYHYRFEKDARASAFGDRLRFYDGGYWQSDIALRNEYGRSVITHVSSANNLLYELLFPFCKSMFNFKIVDNIGNEFKIGFTDRDNTSFEYLESLPCAQSYNIFCYGNNKMKFKIKPKGFDLDKFKYSYWKFLNNEARNSIDFKWLIELKYSHEDLMKISTLDIIPTFEKIRLFELNEYRTLKYY